ncbi:CCA tRNA nucleotidyltransferase [Mechercharimyces sp. CAU 1602]|uniref:CCA tRNA nucleotidyltransferase n=1 Tax=Mechercharimyces sp. CAU 1602 TaxID=2973933 RepID=UPI0021615711|nr:CCA tRNA nucleotidyltransferase [Mechercharimyces sp. CAU 1602]MCS1351012.1 CCA tRNA nucleotidyltransferase [Mechercharimyces sp. CAU 1602]
MTCSAYEVALCVLHTLEKAGYPAYLVGGCVRDRLLQKEPVDYDITTRAHPEKVMELFTHTIPTGLAHGTVTVLMDGHAIEVTTFRTEEGYSDHRRPDRVTFVTDLTADLARRDFTINAIAEDCRGERFDPFEGQADLASRVIRTVGEASARFQEDALRMVRAIRFATQLDFVIETKTRSAIAHNGSLLHTVAVERVTRELEKMWGSAQPAHGLKAITELGLWNHLPPMNSWEGKGKDLPVWMVSVNSITSPYQWWALLLSLLQVPVEHADKRMRQLRVNHKVVQEVALRYQLAYSFPAAITERRGKKLLLTHGVSAVLEGCELAIVLRQLPSSLYPSFQRWKDELVVTHLSQLEINGGCLRSIIPRPPGPWLGNTLDELLLRVACAEIPNEREYLLKEGIRLAKTYS